MDISNAKYINADGEGNDGIEAIIDGSKLYIPLDTANSHYAEILRQVAAGTLTIADAD